MRVVHGIDLADDTAVPALRNALGRLPMDTVICNAGINKSFAAGIDDLDLDVVREEFEVNTFGVIRTVKAALPLLVPGGKLALVSTWRPGVGAASRNYGYQMSKMATSQLSFLLADELAERGITTVLLSPGPMNTELLRAVLASGKSNLRPGQAADPDEVARDLIRELDRATPDDTGAWLFRTGESMHELASSRVWGHG